MAHTCDSECWPYMLRYGQPAQCDPFTAQAAAEQDYPTPDNWS